jgi:hypothetical protein
MSGAASASDHELTGWNSAAHCIGFVSDDELAGAAKSVAAAM